MGYRTIASASVATSFGYETEASGANSTSMGEQTHADGNESVAMGYGSFAGGERSLAAGRLDTVAIGATAGIAMGAESKSLADPQTRALALSPSVGC